MGLERAALAVYTFVVSPTSVTPLLQGRTSILSDVIMSDQPGHDCGPHGDVNMLVRGPQHPVVANVDVLLWAVIPATWTHQHWCVSRMPCASLVLYAYILQ